MTSASKPSSKTDVVFAWEKISSAMADGLEDLIIFNWSEIEAKTDIAPPLDIDWPKYAMLERAGIYRAISMRRGAKLIGYNSYFVQPPLRHKGLLWAVNDTLYIDKDERAGRLGITAVRRSIEMLKAVGVQYVFHGDMLGALNSTSAKPHATFGDLLLREGATLLENIYVFKL